MVRATKVRASKVVRLLGAPGLWPAMVPALRAGVFPSLEHSAIHFGAQFATVVDVGASRGQFGLFALARFPHARLICFEPLPRALATATRLLDGGRTEFHGVALGAVTGQMTLHVSARDDCSSLLPIGRRCVEAFPGTQERTTIAVTVDVLEHYLSSDLPRPCLVKIDVQGSELDVLRGAGDALSVVDEVLVEVSFAELYTGQARADAVISFLADRGVRLVDVCGVARGADGAAIQADLLFRRD